MSPESFPGYHDFPYNTTQATYSAPISNRVLLEAGYSRFVYDYARFGMAAPDGSLTSSLISPVGRCACNAAALRIAK